MSYNVAACLRGPWWTDCAVCRWEETARSSWDDCAGCLKKLRWYGAPGQWADLHSRWVPRPILFYTVRVPYDLGTDWTLQPFYAGKGRHQEAGNAINLVDRVAGGYRIGPGGWRLATPGFGAVGGCAAWLAGGWPYGPIVEIKWRDGRQVPQRIENAWAGYRDSAVLEVA